MRNRKPNARVNTIPKEAPEDKRLFVLFLFGLSLLLVDTLPNLAQDSASVYTLLLSKDDKGKQNWHVVRTRVTDTNTNTKILDGHGQKAQTQTQTQKIFDQPWHVPLPAELALLINQPVPINTANQETLQMLPGIGPVLARAIVETRIKTGAFQKPEDLLRVPGIGPKRLASLRPLVSCHDQPEEQQ